MTYDYLVVGAGLFGATFAREAANRGFKVKVIEKRSHIAGNIYTKEVEGIQVHEYGAHIFHTSDKKILIAYFSVPENVTTEGIDANAGASIVVRNNNVLGNMQYMAMTIQEAVGGELFRIETTEQYPLEHSALVDKAKLEQNKDVRPELATHIDNLNQYDTIFLGYPNWWGDMPQPLYTFLEEYDFSGKTIIPFNSHGGSGFSNTIKEIKKLQPDATVSNEGLSISRNDVSGSAQKIIDWAKGIQ